MPVCLCDGEVYTIENKKENLNRSDLFRFFLDGHRMDMILLLDENGRYDGAVTYRSLINGSDIVTYEKLVVGEENFWKKATEYFRTDKEKVIPVFNREMELQFFARWDRELTDLWNKLRELQMYLDRETWKSLKNYQNHVVFSQGMVVRYGRQSKRERPGMEIIRCEGRRGGEGRYR